MTLDLIIDELGAIETQRAEMRSRAMVYQAAEKERIALRNGVPADSYYFLPYEHWLIVRSVPQ